MRKLNRLVLKALPCLFLIQTATFCFSQNRPIGINLDFLTDYSPQWVFVDAMKQARPWFVIDTLELGWDNPAVTIPSRPDGYPTQVPFTETGTDYFRVHTLLLRELPHLYPEGDYALIFEGTGRIRLDFDAGWQHFTTPNTAHIFTPTPSEEGIHLTIEASDVNDPIHNIRVIMPGFLATYETQPFHPALLNILENFQVLRFMSTQEISEGDAATLTDITSMDNYTQRRVGNKVGLAYEYITDLCNEMNAHLWINIPHRANDALVQHIATVLHNRLNPNLKVYIEYGNELWNTAPPFLTGQEYVSGQGLAMGLAETPYEAGLLFTTYRSLQIFSIFENVFGDTTRMVRVLPAQSASWWVGYNVLMGLSNPMVNPNGGTADALAIGPYFGGYLADNLGFQGLASTITVDAVLDSLEATLVEEIQPDVLINKEMADDFGLELIAYEGGQHLFSNFFMDDAAFTQKFNDANRHPRMRDIYCNYFDLWYNASGNGLMMSFSLATPYNMWGSFGLVDNFMQAPLNFPKFQAHAECVFQTPPAPPFQLQSFYGTYQAVGVLLNWETAFDENIQEYRVEKSSDGMNFALLGTVEGGSLNGSYSFLDYQLMLNGKDQFYRLEMVKMDGSIEYSEVITVKIPIVEFQVFPNPSGGKVKLQFTKSDSAAPMQIQVSNTTGQVLFETSLPGNTSDPLELDLTHLPKGLYFLTVQKEGKKMTRKLVLTEAVEAGR